MADANAVTLFLCGDVMTGRGVDQVLPCSCPPRLYEPVVTSAGDYVALAERACGAIPRPVAPGYVWGDALAVLERERPHARIINLETSITTSELAEPKGINYRMHPGNVAVLEAARIDCCVLANNHVLDWGDAGLLETLETLERARIRVAGAGRDLAGAEAPAVLGVAGARRVLVFAFGAEDSGIPAEWSAGEGRPGVHLIADFSERTADRIARLVDAARLPGDIVVASVHWGGNWGFDVPSAHRRFAHALIDRARVDVVHGHSSHHPKAIEIHRGRPILYGCGDFLNDYEGIEGHERYRGDLVLMYFPTLDAATGELRRLALVPMRIHGFRLCRPSAVDRDWLRGVLDRECRRFGHRVSLRDEETMMLE
ncbi:MAG TPA: CapA family protein [Gemmatimonadaceae bacterium]|nr:CapA family protein [Gemmatimonadaceae bacterium]